MSPPTRVPAPDAVGRPHCFGFEHDPARKACRTCAFKPRCELTTKVWQARKSIAEKLADLESSARPENRTGTTTELYCDLLRQHYTVKVSVRAKASPQFVAAMAWVDDYCDREDIDRALYITAQMHSMMPYLSKTTARVKTFMPNMLRGDNAITRFKAFVLNGHRHFKEASTRTFEGQTAWAAILNEVAESEEDVANAYVQEFVVTGRSSWNDTASLFDSSPVWLGLRNKDRAVTSRMEQSFGRGAPLILPIASLRAANAIAARFHWRLPARISFDGDFSWPDFAALIRSEFQPSALAKPAPTHGDGLAYRFGDFHGHPEHNDVDDV